MQLEATVAASHARAMVLVWELRGLQQFSLCAFAMAHEQRAFLRIVLKC